MPVSSLSLDDLQAWSSGAVRPPDEATGGVVLLDLEAVPAGALLPPLHAGVRAVVVGVALDGPGHPAAAACDVVVVDEPAVDAVLAGVEANPVAALALVGVLRGSEQRTVEDGLLAESAVYSALQAGPEFARWRAGTPRKLRPPQPDPPVQVEREGDVLHLTLARPEVRNALDTAMRDALVESLVLPALDPTITEVHLWGAGQAFCAGGDLDEFGTFDDPASAHLLRLQQSVGRAIHTVAERVTAHLHGACFGSGIELPAFGGRVVADPTTRIALPELGLGLIPGAGGTVSLPRRIGRHRTAELALTGRVIDAPTALAWGLVDEVDQPANAAS